MRLKVTAARTKQLKDYCGPSWAVLNEGGMSQAAADERRALASAFFFSSCMSIPAVTDTVDQDIIKIISIMKNI